MPKTLEQISKTGKTVNNARIGGKKLDFAPIVQKILKSGQGFTVKEVHESKNLVNQVLSHQRTYKLLMKEVKAGTLSRTQVAKDILYHKPFETKK